MSTTTMMLIGAGAAVGLGLLAYLLTSGDDKSKSAASIAEKDDPGNKKKSNSRPLSSNSTKILPIFD